MKIKKYHQSVLEVGLTDSQIEFILAVTQHILSNLWEQINVIGRFVIYYLLLGLIITICITLALQFHRNLVSLFRKTSYRPVRSRCAQLTPFYRSQTGRYQSKLLKQSTNDVENHPTECESKTKDETRE